MISPQKIYRETVREMSREERLQLAALILNDLATPAVPSATALRRRASADRERPASAQ